MVQTPARSFPFLFGETPRLSAKMLNALQYPVLAVAVFGGAGMLMQIIPPGSEVSLLRYATEATFTSALIVAVIVLWRSNVAFVKMLMEERKEHKAELNKVLEQMRSLPK